MSTREKLEKKLNNYLVLYPPEKKTTKIMIEFLKNDQDCFKRNNWNGHFTGSSWVLDETRSYVLMVHHRQLNLWLQPGGHADGRADLLSVAIDETREETGLTRLKIISEEIFDLDIHEIPRYNDVPPHFHYDIRFLLEAKRIPSRIKVSNESYDVRWININTVLHKNNESSISRMLNKISL